MAYLTKLWSMRRITMFAPCVVAVIASVSVFMMSCDTNNEAVDLSVTITEHEGENAGCQIYCPAGAYSGSTPLTISEGQPIVKINDSVDDYKILGIAGPPMKMSPPTTFISPVTLWIPFSTEAYNAITSDGTKAITIIAQNNDGDPIRLDTGPINMASVSLDTGPINLSQDGDKLDTGPIDITANEGNDTYDALFSLKVDHFTTFQVVVVEVP